MAIVLRLLFEFSCRLELNRSQQKQTGISMAFSHRILADNLFTK